MSEEAKQAQRALQESMDLRDQDHTDAEQPQLSRLKWVRLTSLGNRRSVSQTATTIPSRMHSA